MNVTEWRTILQTALARSQAGESIAALKDLDRSIDEAVRVGDSSWVGLLARNAGVIAEAAGSTQSAVRYYEIAAKHEPNDPLVCVALATLLWNENEPQSRSWISKATELANARGNTDALELIAAWRKDRNI